MTQNSAYHDDRNGLTIGVEEEFLVVDTTTGELAPRGPELLRSVPPGRDDEVTSELNNCQIEINSPVCQELSEVLDHLNRLRGETAAMGVALGVRPCPLASHPWSSWQDQDVNRSKDRYVALEETYQQIAREQVICGCHVHVGIDDPDAQVRVMNRVRGWLPVLLALSANSPYWDGQDTGYASYRTMVWRRWPTATMPPFVADYAAYERLIASLVEVEAIESAQSLYWYVRPSSHLPTLEFRVTDVCLSANDAVVIAGLARALAATCRIDSEVVSHLEQTPAPLLDTAMWRAARYGVDGTLIDPVSGDLLPAREVVDKLVAFVQGSLNDSGDLEFVETGLEEVFRRGNGASRQRRYATGSEPQSERLWRILDVEGDGRGVD